MKNNKFNFKKNIDYLILGLLFIGYGLFQIYNLFPYEECNLGSSLIAGVFIAFGYFDLKKYFLS